jgi:hypothetical protein
MPVSMNNTQVVFNDATTQTTSAVTAVNVGTGISSTGGKTPTLTNTGVTSIVAGTGITISGGTGAVTVNASGGGVTSLNGETGAITNTGFNAIGSYSAGSTEGGSYSPGATLAGTSLRQNSPASDVQGPFLNLRAGLTSNEGQTGTWRAMAKSTAFNFCGIVIAPSNLWVRIS